jgi:DNA-binding LacI/PurR family transcriptional regulator
MDPLLARLRQDLEAQRWAPGERLPAERELADLYRISRPAIRSVLAVLVAEGRIQQESPRIRVVAPAGPARRLKHTAGLLTKLSTAPVDGADFMQEVVRGFLARMQAAGQQVLTIDPAQTVTEAGRREVAAQVDLGLIILDDVLDDFGLDLISAFQQLGCRVVASAESLPPSMVTARTCDLAASDHRRGADQLVRALAARGARRIQRVVPPAQTRSDRWWWHERQAGIAAACAACGVSLMADLAIPELGFYDRTPASFGQLAQAHSGFLMHCRDAATRPDALFIPSDGNIPPIAAGLRLLGVPSGSPDLIGYDHYWRRMLESRFESQAPALSVDKRSRHVGEALASLLIERADGTLTGPPQLRMIDPVLITDPVHG